MLCGSIALAATTPTNRPPRGYQSSACNFDLDDDFVYGEPVDDCNVCDGQTGNTPVSVDYDGDTVNETEVYIHYQTGVNSPGRGGPAQPYQTLLYAIGQEGAGEIAYCIAGTSTDQQVEPGNGGSGTKTRTASGSEMLDFDYPSNPLMIIGWDTDDDGQYPPVDTDDSGTIDMTQVTSSQWVRIVNSRIEIAHLDISGSPPSGEINVFTMSNCGAGNRYSHVYFHDLQITNYYQNQPSLSDNQPFATWTSACGVTFLAVENINSTNQGGGFFTRGGVGYSSVYPDTDFRFKNISVTVDGQDSSGWIFSKHWGELTRVEYIDNYIDYQAGVAWSPGANPAPPAFAPAQCAQDILIRNNYVAGSGRFGHIQGSAASFCDTRPVCNQTAGAGNGCVIDGNEYVHDYGYQDDQFVKTTDGNLGSTSIGDIYILNNVVTATTSIQNMIYDQGSPMSNSTITVVGNTFEGTLDGGGGGGLWIPNNAHENWDMRNNIWDISGAVAIGDNNAPTGWSANNNVYPSGTGWWAWGGVNQTTLANWQSASSSDGAAVQCSPTYVSGTDFHLASGDTCAQDAGTDITDATTIDYDGQARQTTNADVGADELEQVTGNLAGMTVSGATIQ